MIVPDLNLLIYAVNGELQHHDDARRWWESVLNGTEEVGLPWVVLLGFLRLTTSPRVFSSPPPVSTTTPSSTPPTTISPGSPP